METFSQVKKQPFFTLFIGLYNSEHVIHRFFESIKKQTCRDFELIIIDDYSKDNTVEIVEKFLLDVNDIDVQFIKHKANKGIAFSREESLNLAKGHVFVKWDHDDIQDPSQLREFKQTYLKYKDKNVASVWCLCKDMKESIIGNKYPKDEVISNYLEMYSKYILSTSSKPKERHNCINVEVHKKIYNYIYEHHILPKEISPTATDIWSVMALMGYKTVYINKPLRQYFIENNRPRMSNAGRLKNADRIYFDRITWLNHYMKHLPRLDLFWRVRLFASVVQYGVLSQKELLEILKDIKSFFHQMYVLIFFIPIKLYLKIR